MKMKNKSFQKIAKKGKKWTIDTNFFNSTDKKINLKKLKICFSLGCNDADFIIIVKFEFVLEQISQV